MKQRIYEVTARGIGTNVTGQVKAPSPGIACQIFEAETPDVSAADILSVIFQRDAPDCGDQNVHAVPDELFRRVQAALQCAANRAAKSADYWKRVFEASAGEQDKELISEIERHTLDAENSRKNMEPILRDFLAC